MMTQTHFLMTAAVRKGLPRWAMPAWAVLLGSVAPDIPLTVLSLGGFAYFTGMLGWTGGEAARRMYGTLYFENPWWIGAHSLLHSPTSVLLLLVGVQWGLGRWPAWQRFARWFLLACLFHSLVDVATHYDDGPVVFWPFEWSYRFASPVSYWDPAHYGREFAVFELALTGLLVGYLVLPWAARRVATLVRTREA